MRAFASVLSVIGLACASAPEPNLAERPAPPSSSSAGPLEPPSSATALSVPAPVSLAKAALEQGGDEGQEWVSSAWGRFSFQSPLDWSAMSVVQGRLLLPPGEQKPFHAALFVSQSEADPLVALERALPISHCRWLPEESATVGRAKLAAEIVDGACVGGDEIVAIARVRYAGASVAFFIWTKGADPAPLWQIARSVGHLAPQRLMPCCVALRQNAKSAPPAQIAQYQQAADICTLDLAGANPDTLAKVRAALLGASVPAVCR